MCVCVYRMGGNGATLQAGHVATEAAKCVTYTYCDVTFCFAAAGRGTAVMAASAGNPNCSLYTARRSKVLRSRGARQEGVRGRTSPRGTAGHHTRGKERVAWRSVPDERPYRRVPPPPPDLSKRDRNNAVAFSLAPFEPPALPRGPRVRASSTASAGRAAAGGCLGPGLECPYRCWREGAHSAGRCEWCRAVVAVGRFRGSPGRGGRVVGGVAAAPPL